SFGGDCASDERCGFTRLSARPRVPSARASVGTRKRAKRTSVPNYPDAVLKARNAGACATLLSPWATRRSTPTSSTGHPRKGGPRAIGPNRNQRSGGARSEEHTSELQSRENLVCRLLLEKK